MQHWQSGRYREWKRELVVTTLSQAGIDAPMDALIDAHGEGRRRATFHARRGSSGRPEVGFSAARAHDLIPIDACPVLAPSLDGALKAARAIAEALSSQGKPLDIQVTATEGGLDIDVRGSGELNSARTAKPGPRRAGAAAGPADPPRRTGRAERAARGDDGPRQRGAAARRIPAGDRSGRSGAGRAGAGAYRQGEERRRPVLRRRAVRAAACRAQPASRRSIWTPPRSPRCKQAANGVSGLKPVEATARDLFRRPLVAQELTPFDAVVFDPPRQGAQAQAARACQEQGAARCRGVVQRGDLRARCEAIAGRRLPAHARDAGRSVPLLAACRDRGAVRTQGVAHAVPCPRTSVNHHESHRSPARNGSGCGR